MSADDLNQHRNEERMELPAHDSVGTKTVLLHEEQLVVGKHATEQQLELKISVTERNVPVSEILQHEYFDITRIPMDLLVDVAPPPREEGDTTIISLVEEVLVVEKRIRVKEEIHLRRVITTKQHEETVRLRVEEATVIRTPGDADT